jgi:hypothetical protein
VKAVGVICFAQEIHARLIPVMPGALRFVYGRRVSPSEATAEEAVIGEHARSVSRSGGA